MNTAAVAAVPDVSVLIIARNAQATIVKAIESALSQDDVRTEVIVVDDASTDATATIVDDFVRIEPRIRLFRIDRRGGPGPARNVALAHATAPWVAILDADDYFHPRRLSALLAVARERNADMVADNLWLVDGPTDQPFDLMLTSAHISSPQTVTADSFVRNNRPLNIKRKYGLLKPVIRVGFLQRHAIRYREDAYLGEDFLFYLECLIQGARFVLLPEAYYFYALSRTSLTRTRSVGQARTFLKHCDELLQRSDVRLTAGLAGALTDRSRQLRSDLVYLRFAKALKRGRVHGAWFVLISRPRFVPYVARHIGRVGVLRFRQWLAGASRQAWLGNASHRAKRLAMHLPTRLL